jgi:tetratricopeptide (TPR) repeat protein
MIGATARKFFIIALSVGCAVACSFAASAQKVIGCQNADWSAGACRSGGGGPSGPIYVPPPVITPEQRAADAVREGDSHFLSDLERAIAAYLQALNWLPNDAEIERKLRHARAEMRYREAETAHRAGDLDRALALLKEAERIDPGDGRYQRRFKMLKVQQAVDRGNMYRQMKDYEAAARAYREGSPYSPGVAPHDMLEQLALQAEALGRAAKAKAASDRGKMAWERTDYRGAIAAYEEALRHDPTAAYARERLQQVKADQANETGRAFLKDGLYDSAIKAFEEALRHDPTADYARRNLDLAKTQRETDKGNSFYQAKDYDTALAKYDDALRQNPNSEFLRAKVQRTKAAKASKLGRMLYEARDYEGAVKAFAEAVRHDPDAGYAAENLRKAEIGRHLSEGDALMRRGEREGAIAAFKRVIEIDANNSRARESLVEAESIRGVVSSQMTTLRNHISSGVSEALDRARRLVGDDGSRGALSEVRAAQSYGKAAASLPATRSLDDRASATARTIFDTGGIWSGAGESVASNGRTNAVAAPPNTWKPLLPQQETKQMAALHQKIDSLEQTMTETRLQRDKETDPVKKSELKDREFKAEYQRKILEKEYKSYAPLTAPPGDDAPASDGSAAPKPGSAAAPRAAAGSLARPQ